MPLILRISQWKIHLYEARIVNDRAELARLLAPLDAALRRHSVARRNVLELPGFLGLSTLVSKTDLLATLPREIGETVALMSSLQVLPCPFPIQRFTVKQYWHPRYDLEPGSRWLRNMCSTLFKQEGIRSPMAARVG